MCRVYFIPGSHYFVMKNSKCPARRGIKLAWALMAERTSALVRGTSVPATSRVEPREGPESGLPSEGRGAAGCPPRGEVAGRPGTLRGGGDPVARVRRRTTDSALRSPRTRRPQCCGPAPRPRGAQGPVPVARPANSCRAPATRQAPSRCRGGHQDETATISVFPLRARVLRQF